MNFRTIPGLQHLLQTYLTHFPNEKKRVENVANAIQKEEPIWKETHPTGHLTGSAFILDASCTKSVAILHKKHNVWVQAGGHIEDHEPSLWQAALREAEEETGLKNLQYLPLIPKFPDLPFDWDVHNIPFDIKRGHGEHWHYDCRYVFVAPQQADFQGEYGELNAIRWVDLRDPEIGDPSFLFGNKKIAEVLLQQSYYQEVNRSGQS